MALCYLGKFSLKNTRKWKCIEKNCWFVPQELIEGTICLCVAILIGVPWEQDADSKTFLVYYQIGVWVACLVTGLPSSWEEVFFFFFFSLNFFLKFLTAILFFLLKVFLHSTDVKGLKFWMDHYIWVAKYSTEKFNFQKQHNGMNGFISLSRFTMLI